MEEQIAVVITVLVELGVIVYLLVVDWKRNKKVAGLNGVICSLKREVFNLTNTDPTLEFKVGNCGPTKVEEE